MTAYRYQGRPGWTPEGVGPVRSASTANESARRRQKARTERSAEFCRLRDEQVPVEEAAAVVGISERTGRAYETERRRAAKQLAVAVLAGNEEKR